MNIPLIPKRWTPGFPLKRSRRGPSFCAHKYLGKRDSSGWQGIPRSQDRLPDLHVCRLCRHLVVFMCISLTGPSHPGLRPLHLTWACCSRESHRRTWVTSVNSVSEGAGGMFVNERELWGQRWTTRTLESKVILSTWLFS